jgi:hypothetical protein
MADIYVDSAKEVLKINGKCYSKVTGDFGYQTHTKSVIRDSFDTTCTDCWITLTINAGETAILRKNAEYLRFNGSPGDTALIIIDDGNGIYNIEVSNDGGNFVFDKHNTNGIEKVFGAPPETYTFTLGGLTHNITLAKLGSFFLDFRFNITDETIIDLFPGDSNRDGVPDSSGGDIYSEVGAIKAGFSVNDVSTHFANNAGNYIEVEFKDVYRFKSSIPNPGSREDTVQEITDNINLITEDTGIRASFDGDDFMIWFTANNSIKPSLTVIESIVGINQGFEQIVTTRNYRDSDNDGVLDVDDCDPLNLTGGAVPKSYDTENISRGFPVHENDHIKICFEGGRIPPKRCYRSSAVDRKNALKEIAEHIERDYQIGLTSFTAQIQEDGNIHIVDPVTGAAPPIMVAEITVNGVTSVLSDGLVTPAPIQPPAINVAGLTDYGGAPNGDYALIATVGGLGYRSYSNNNGWEIYNDGTQFVITDTPGAKSGNWLGNGSANDTLADYDTGFGFNVGQIGTCTVVNFQVTGGMTATFSQTSGVCVYYNDILDLKKYDNSASLNLKLSPGYSASINYWLFDKAQPCVHKEGAYKTVVITNEGGSLVFDATNKYDSRYEFEVINLPESVTANLLDPAERKYAQHGEVSFEVTSYSSGTFLVTTSV